MGYQSVGNDATKFKLIVNVGECRLVKVGGCKHLREFGGSHFQSNHITDVNTWVTPQKLGN